MKVSLRHATLIGLVLLTGTSLVSADAGSVRAEMSKMASELSKFGAEQFPSQKPTLAILPFQAEEKLASGGRGVALSQLLSHYVFAEGAFTLVERAELEKVMSEQKLSLTGTIENSTALKVGHLLGSKYLILGTLTQLGGKYQINARLVDAQSGQIMKTLFTEVDKEALDDETRDYLPLVPQKEVISLSLAYISSYFTAPSLRYVPPELNVQGNPVTIEVDGVKQGVIGLELRYFPLKRLSAVVGVFPTETRKTVPASASFYSPYFASPNDYSFSLTLGPAYSAGLNYTFMEKGHLRVIGGGGALLSHVKYEYPPNHAYVYDGDIQWKYLLLGQSKEDNILLGYLNIGLEYMIKQRLAAGIALNSFLGTLPAFKYYYRYSTFNGPYILSEDICNPEPEKCALKAYVSLYF